MIEKTAAMIRPYVERDTTPVDTADLNLADMGTMNRGMGGGMMGMTLGMPGTTTESTKPTQIPNWNAVSAEAPSASGGVPADSPQSSEPQEPADSQPAMRPSFGRDFPSGDGAMNFPGTQNPTSDATAWALVL